MAPDESKMLMLSTDHPLTDPSEDLLGYAAFARMLAHSVLRGSPAAGLVVGIYGEWGLGKTTLLNFIDHFVSADVGDEPPVIVRFNPWWFSGREDLFRRFFKEFEAAVLKRNALNKRVRDALRTFGDAVGNLPVSWVAGVGKVVAAATKLGQPADVVGLKGALVQALNAEALRVIVLIDDIDRLLPSEMIDLFRLVRSVGDFPNVHYVLAFERQVVVKALTEECHTDGERYLEKIIQAPFELPRPGAPTLQKLFTHRLNEVLVGTDEELFDAKYWGEVFLQGIAPFLQTPRDVTRLINALAVIYPSVRNEVNPVDFVAIETVRIFAPEAYDVVRLNRKRFIGMLLHADHLRDENKRFHEQWIATIERDRDAVKAIVIRLFPKIAPILAKTSGGSDRDAVLRRGRRICSEHMFDVYFRYALDRGLSRAAFLKLLECSPDELRAELERLSTERLENGQIKLRWFLEMLRDELSAGEGVTRPDLLKDLCSLGDAVIAGPRAFTFEVSDAFLLAFVVGKLLQRLQPADRAPALRAALEAAGVSTVAMIVVFLGAQHGRHGEQASPPDERAIPSADDLNGLEALARDRIEQASADGTLWTSPRFRRVLLDWRRLGTDVQAREAVAKWCADDENLLKLITSFSGSDDRGRGSINTEALGALLDLDAIARRAKILLDEPPAEPKVRDLLRSFLDAYGSTAAARNEQQARIRILNGILDEVERTGSYPSMHWVQTRFEPERPVIERSVQEGLIQQVLEARCMITMRGLQLLGPDARSVRELRACSLLVMKCQEEYRRSDKAKVELEKLAREMDDKDVDASALRRAALVLLAAQTPGIQVEWGGEGGTPSAVSVTDAILGVSSELAVDANV